MSRFSDRADAVRLIVHESLPHLIRDRDLVGWIQGADAKTVEDVEERRRLEGRVRLLQDQLAKLEAADRLLVDEFASGAECLEVELKTGKGVVRESATWDDVFRVAGRECMTEPGRTHIKNELSQYLIGRYFSGATDPVPGHIVDDDFGKIETQFVALGYVSIKTAYRQARQHTSDHGPSMVVSALRFSPGWVSGWRLTDRGVRKLADLVAICRARSDEVKPDAFGASAAT